MTGRKSSTNSSILARRAFTEIDFRFAVNTHVTWFAVAMVVIDELNTVLSAKGRAGVREALVDVSFTARTNKTWRTLTLIAAYFVSTSTVVVANPLHTVVHVDFTNIPQSSRRARAAVAVNKIVAGAAILTGIRGAVVDVEFTVKPLKPFGAVTGVGAD